MCSDTSHRVLQPYVRACGSGKVREHGDTERGCEGIQDGLKEVGVCRARAGLNIMHHEPGRGDKADLTDAL